MTRSDSTAVCFDARDLRPVRAWLARPPAGLEVGVDGATTTRETFYDTPDGRFHRAGLVLSVRREEKTTRAWTVPLDGSELPPADEALGADTVEALAAGDGPVGRRVRALTHDTPLEPRFELLSHREGFWIAGQGGGPTRVVLDEIAIPLDGQDEPLKLNRVEVTGPDPGQGPADSWVVTLRSSFGLQRATSARYTAALQALGRTPPPLPDLGPTDLDAGQSTGERAFAVLRRQFVKVLAHDPGTRLGEDIEALHDMRVATRRMRAAIRLFDAYLPHRVRMLRTQLSWLGRALGEVRDLDVQLEQLDTWREELAEEDRAALDALGRIYDGQRDAARKRMLRSLGSRRFTTLVARTTAALRAGPAARSRVARTPILEAAPELIGKRYRRVLKGGKAIDRDSPEEAYHRLRIRCKALRYALEFHRGVYGPRAEGSIKRLVALQDLLGDHQDAAVASESLRQVIGRHGKRLPPHTLFVVGMLAERYARRAADLRRGFPKAFHRMRRRYKLLARTMDAARPTPAPARVERNSVTSEEGSP